MWEWIQTWTFFNWLAVAAFLMALVGFLNSTLSLKSRYKDRLALKNKESFNARKTELENQFNDFLRYDSSPILLFLDIAKDAIISAIFVLVAFGFFIYAFTEYILSQPSDKLAGVFAVFPFYFSIFCLLLPIFTLWELAFKIKYFQRPDLLLREISDFLIEGRKKELISPEEMERMIELLGKIKETKIYMEDVEKIKAEKLKATEVELVKEPANSSENPKKNPP